ncbi:PD-(D/E)XK nuclease family protein [Mycobacterium sp. CnD-18-1]|uniref:PD-(D/E)XK nuclease family protein n=1 Tax=Mycobacterium sp. CnD-18-1 TaxID=2917744 RepID=UPI001EF1E41D|nr:PD-(D/E)XK nuclease family protein [Mycobacterium sp. CnD-18-1]MCG7607171.1 PD-(D/E)XK nuclease family protein [Mycobacterium sp. CnD-18-1]
MEGETTEAALDAALGEIKKLWDRTAPKPLEIAEAKSPLADTAEKKYCWASGCELFFDPVAHTYRDAQGNYYKGGSSFAKKFVEPFAAEIVSKRMADKANVAQQDILDMWSLGGEASSSFGTGVHAALEQRGRYGALSLALKGNYESATTKNPTLRPIVEKFFTGDRAGVKAEYETLVADPARLHAGLIDRLELFEDGVRVTDFKTYKEPPEKSRETILAPFTGLVPPNKLGVAQLQLSFYSRILQVHGVNVLGLTVYHWTGDDWVEYPLDVIDLDGAFEEKK